MVDLGGEEMKFVWVTMIVSDLAKTQQFYEEFLGLSVKRTFAAGPDTQITFLGDGDTQIELIYHGNGDAKAIGNDISLGFEVDSLDKTLELAQNKGIEIVSGIIQPNPHIKFFYVLDPNGARYSLLRVYSYSNKILYDI